MGKNYRGPLAVLAVIVLLAAKGLYSYYLSYDYALQRRAELARQNRPEIHVAVVWDLLREKSFLDGVKLAASETNRTGIRLVSDGQETLGKLVLHEYDDGTADDAEDTWLAVSAARDIVAVVGHSSSATAIPASISYEYNGVLFISAVATSSALTAPKFKYTFSIVPTDQAFADALVSYAETHRLYKLVVLYARSEYGLGFYESFVSALPENFDLIATRSFFETEEDKLAGNLSSTTGTIYQLMQQDFDAVVVAAKGERGAAMVEQLRDMGVDKPILGSEALDDEDVWRWSHHTANRLFVASVFAKDSTATPPLTQAFIDNFRQAYGYEPGYYAFQGYEAVKVLASAYQLAGSTVPIRVAAALQFGYKNGYNGYVFDRHSRITNKKIVIKEMVNGKFNTIDPE
ncbi:MAG: ABC transporter substrate-binding protein [Methylovulum sp.]|nr:ABC transporter substrate-binding protein [Methylovulum sp.]